MINILFICKGTLDKAVPIISIAQALNAAENEIEIICSNISVGLKDELVKSGIKILSLDLDEPNSSNRLSKICGKLYHWLAFRWHTKRILTNKSPDYLYVATADTAIALRGVLSKYKYILHLRELYDKHPCYMKLIKKPAQQAYKVVVPEENRAYLYYDFLNLKNIPAVIPNKPFYHPRQAKMNIGFLDSEIQYKISSKKNIIYQGPIHIERNLTVLINASAKLTNYNIILMGKDFGLVNAYRKINPNIIHIPFVRPPLHLNITSWAHIGVITYDFNSLNTIYCAPNKIWEFTGFNIPILGNLNPGIKYTISQAKAGVVVDFEDEQAIIKGICVIEDNYSKIQDHANAFYNSINPDRINQLII